MGEVAVGARSGHEGAEEGQQQLAESPAVLTDDTTEPRSGEAAEAGTGPEAAAGEEPGKGTGPGSGTEAGTEAGTGPETQPETGTEAGAGPEASATPGTGTVPEAGAEPDTAAEVKDETGPGAGAEPVTEAGTGAEPVAEAEAGAEPQADAAAVAGTEPVAGAEVKAGADAVAGTEPAAGARSETDTEPKAGTEPKDGTGAVAVTGPGTGTESVGGTEGVTVTALASDAGPGSVSGPATAPGPESEIPDSGDSGAAKQRSFWKELPLLIGIALLLALLIKTFLVQAFSIPSDSMQDTLQRGDRVLVDKLTPWFGSEPERGEVVVFHDPGGWLEDAETPDPNVAQKFLSFIGLMPSAEEKDLIKRVIAVGGDTVECKKGGKVQVNGHPLNESGHIYPGNTPCDDEPFGPIHVPQGRIWVMGDHRQNSLDSRYHQELPGRGTVSTDEVVGRAFVVAWPLNRWSLLPVPDTFDQPGLSTAASVASAAAPGAIGLAGAVPLVLWRRRRLTGGSTAG